MKLPLPRGPLSAAVLDALRAGTELDSSPVTELVDTLAGSIDQITDDDFQLALWVLYELHYRGFDDVPADQEWQPELIRVRLALEAVFERELRRRTEPNVREAMAGGGEVAERLFGLTEGFDGPSVSRFLHRTATQ